MNPGKPQFWELERYTDLVDTPTTILNNRNVISGSKELGWDNLFDRNFTGLNDTPINYTGQGGKNVVVRGDGLGLEFVAPPIKTRITSILPQTTLGYTRGGQGSRANRGGVFNIIANANQRYWWRMLEGFPIRALSAGDKITGNCLVHWRDTTLIDVHSRWVDGTTIFNNNFNGVSILVQNHNLYIRLADGTTSTRYLMEAGVGTRINVKWEYEHGVGVRAWLDDVFQGTYVHGNNNFMGNRWYNHINGVHSYSATDTKQANFGHEWLEF